MDTNQPIPISTTITEVPQLQTVVQDGLAPISSIINAPWVQVTSVNGMTGDVVVEISLLDFEPNHYYSKNTAIIYSGSLYYAKADFTSGTSFNPNDWNFPTFTQVQADWDTTTATDASYIKNKPTKLSDFTNDSGFLDAIQVSTQIEDATDPLFEELDTISTNVSSLSGNVSSLTGDLNTLSSSVNNKVDKETGKGLSTNDFTNAYKTLLNNIKSTIFEQTYPIGSIYFSVTISTASSVAENLGGGTWVAWGSGRVPVGVNTSDSSFNTVEKTGGEKSHTLSLNEMPKHQHGIYSGYGDAEITGSGDAYRYQTWANYNRGWHGGDLGTSEVGKTYSHNNLQPYITVYMWKRVE